MSVSRKYYGYRKGLTANERYVVTDVVSRVIDAMQWDKTDSQYTDEGNFMLRLSKSDFQSLKRAYKKL